MGLRIRDLRAGGRYLHSNGNFVRTIDYIEGNSVYWHDECGPGTGTRNVFLKRCQGFAPDETGSIQTPDQKDSPMIFRCTEITEVRGEFSSRSVMTPLLRSKREVA